MQEFQPIPGLAGRLFGGVGASDLRRAQQGPGARCDRVSPVATAPEAVKCPRCQSTNTKFCYYNNYNLSQPRHFCKSCRRYWTKGGVLRNVPVGGGCRKAKRSSSSSSSAAPSTPTLTEAKNPRRASGSSPRGTNSGSTSPTRAGAATTTTTTTTPATPSSSNNIAITGGLSTNPFSTVDMAPPAPIFADQAAALASLFAPPPPPPPPLPVFSFTAQAQPKDEGVASVLLATGQALSQPDEAAAADMATFTSLDDAGIFEQLDNASAAYWNAGSCWTDVVQDPNVYLP